MLYRRPSTYFPNACYFPKHTVPAARGEVLSLGPADPPYNATLQAYGNRDVEFMSNAVYLSTTTNVHELFLCRNKSATDWCAHTRNDCGDCYCFADIETSNGYWSTLFAVKGRYTMELSANGRNGNHFRHHCAPIHCTIGQGDFLTAHRHITKSNSHDSFPTMNVSYTNVLTTGPHCALTHVYRIHGPAMHACCQVGSGFDLGANQMPRELQEFSQ